MAGDDRRQGAEDRPAAPDLHRVPRSRLRPDGPAQVAPGGRGLVATWTLTIRAGARVERLRFDTLKRALAELEARVDELANAAKREPSDTKLRRYTPAEQVVARIELAGPERRLAGTHAGVDVHGDGSTEAYVGRIRRESIDPTPGEGAAAALRRVLHDR